MVVQDPFYKERWPNSFSFHGVGVENALINSSIEDMVFLISITRHNNTHNPAEYFTIYTGQQILI